MPESRRKDSRHRPPAGEERDSRRPGAGRVAPLALVISLVLLGLLSVVGWHQFHPPRKLMEKSLREQSRLVYVPACRGELQARDGTPLNLTLPAYSIVLRPDMVRDPLHRVVVCEYAFALTTHIHSHSVFVQPH